MIDFGGLDEAVPASGLLGYLNFSQCRPDPRWQCQGGRTLRTLGRFPDAQTIALVETEEWRPDGGAPRRAVGFAHAFILLRAASFLAPRHRRKEWLREWSSELWYVPRDEAIRFSLGAIRDALWVRRHSTPEPLSPAQCLDQRIETWTGPGRFDRQ